MCGITGWISTLPERFGPATRHVLPAMQRALRHRGPDGRGAHVDPPRAGRQLGAALGFTRLAIRDLDHGAQPMHGGRAGVAAERVVATLNGELYDEARLLDALREAGCAPRSRCDAELLAHGAAIWGDQVWPRLEGMFAAAVWHPGDATLTLARDGAGQKPLYVALVDEGRTALWGSEIGALLAHPALHPRLDPRGVDALLWLDYVPAPGSLLRGVYKLPPAALWAIRADESGALRLITTDLPTLARATPIARSGRRRAARRDADAPWQLDEAVDALDERLGEAVRRRLVSDVPLGVFLSGGVDSSLVAYYAARHAAAGHAEAGHAEAGRAGVGRAGVGRAGVGRAGVGRAGVGRAGVGRATSERRGQLRTLSVAFDEPSFDEAPFAREVATHLGTDHRQIGFGAADAATSLDTLLTSADEPLADPSLLVTLHLCRVSGLKVALGGDGGDEAWLGYPTFAIHGVAETLRHLPSPMRRAAATVGRHLPPSERNLAATEKTRRFLDGLAGPAAAQALTWIGGMPPDRLHTVHAAAEIAEEPWDAQIGWGAPVSMVERLVAELRAGGRVGLDVERALLARTYLAEGVLQKVDRAAMAHGVEVRAPWLDRDVLALAASLPAELLLGGGLSGAGGKAVPRALAARVLPRAVSQRPKKGFGVPLGAWLRGPLAARMRHDLRPTAIAEVPGLRAAGVLKLMDAHLSGRQDHRKTLFAIWRLVAWWRGHCRS